MCLVSESELRRRCSQPLTPTAAQNAQTKTPVSVSQVSAEGSHLQESSAAPRFTLNLAAAAQMLVRYSGQDWLRKSAKARRGLGGSKAVRVLQEMYPKEL